MSTRIYTRSHRAGVSKRAAHPRKLHSTIRFPDLFQNFSQEHTPPAFGIAALADIAALILEIPAIAAATEFMHAGDIAPPQIPINHTFSRGGLSQMLRFIPGVGVTNTHKSFGRIGRHG